MYLGEFFKAIQEKHEIDPIDYDEAISDVTTHIWKEAMKAESESIYFYQVQELVEVPKGLKPIGCKWAYKRKRGVDGKVETFKARLIVKVYSQKPSFDYEETQFRL